MFTVKNYVFIAYPRCLICAVGKCIYKRVYMLTNITYMASVYRFF